METKLKIIDAYKKSEKRDRTKILTRKNVIENRKEKLEIISKERVRQLKSFISASLNLFVMALVLLGTALVYWVSNEAYIKIVSISIQTACHANM